MMAVALLGIALFVRSKANKTTPTPSPDAITAQ
jgi:hypothetical protein